MELLKTLCHIHAPSGEEKALSDFLIEYINTNKSNWKTEPKLYYGDDFQDCIVLEFGTPRTAILLIWIA